MELIQCIYLQFFFAAAMSNIEWARFQNNLWITSCTLDQMRLNATFQNHMAFVVRANDSFIVARQFGWHFHNFSSTSSPK